MKKNTCAFLLSFICAILFCGCTPSAPTPLDYDPNIFIKVNFNGRSLITYGRPNVISSRMSGFQYNGNTIGVGAWYDAVKEVMSGGGIRTVSNPDQFSISFGGSKTGTTLLGDYDGCDGFFIDETPNIPDLPIRYELGYNSTLPSKITITSVQDRIMIGSFNSFLRDSTGQNIPITGEFRLPSNY